jgi:hypothetical protein
VTDSGIRKKPAHYFFPEVAMSGAPLDDISYSQDGMRRTPRKSFIVVIPDNHAVSPEAVAERLPTGDDDLVDVIVACAGQPGNLGALTRRIRDIQVLLAPAGTSPADLRELAIRQTAADIVTLLSGAVQPSRASELFTTA